MTVATRTDPNYTSQSAAQYKANIDAAFAVDKRIAASFAPHEQTVGSPAPDMSVRIDAGFIWSGSELVEIAAQTVSGFTTPASGYVRIDRVALNPSTGVCTRIAGTAQTVGSPTAVAPQITAGLLPICQIAFTSSTAVIVNSMITDERLAPGIGQLTMPGRPAFLVTVSAAQDNVTGDGTTYTAQWDVEIFDQNGNFASNTFTAPVTGRYQLNLSIAMQGMLTTHTATVIDLVTSNASYRLNDGWASNPYTNKRYTLSVLADMDAGDTATVTVFASGGTKVVDLGASGRLSSSFSGFLAC